MRAGAWPTAPEALPVAVVDNHCHLEFPAGEPELTVERRLADAAAVGVDRVVQIGCELDSARWTADAVDRYPTMLGGVALHPNEAPLHAAGTHDSGLSYDDALAEIAALARHDRIRVIGETGLDYFRTSEEGREAQVRSFRDHIALAKELGLPLQIHDRDAHADVLDVLERDGAPDVTVFHCFSGDAAMARLCAHRGYYLSFAGTVTFKNAEGLRAALAVTPLSQVLVETDAPFLTPHPHRGAPNAPYLVPLTMRTVASVLDVDLALACETVSSTSENLYGPW
ncbi:TatD family hydrolase [Demequina sp. SYSU T00192]|uniref:TatD family hydrolase n=1 Tax=Demequina litoralis TaxID=3051660 RepID=A0ABT8G8U5_9MICO|nr:TatD family hydrolase [Demequina sp. SYSU T00192]MDN4475565.1 TatD family hydrolase [Demequina sp. SYSU T00192]